MADIEALRQANIAQKTKLLAGLNLGKTEVAATVKSNKHERDSAPYKRRKLGAEVGPTRSSARLQNVPAPSYKDETKLFELVDRPSRRAAATTAGTSTAKGRQIDLPQHPIDSINPATDIDEIRRGWVDWKPVGTPPSRTVDGTLYFEDYQDFTPNKTPEEMLREGAFGGTYFRPVKSARLGVVVRDDWRELPAEWIEGLDVEKQVASPIYDPDVNKFKVACGQTIEEWESAGWISTRDDVRGWFQWYCRFYQGRRCGDDDRQVSRWKKCCGPTGRWKRMLLKKYKAYDVREVIDPDGDQHEVSPVMHQTCHHWAYEIKQKDLDDYWIYN